jgi:arylsulfatase
MTGTCCGQRLWLKYLESYTTCPPLQAPESYNLSQILEQLKQGPHASGEPGLITAGRA